MTKSITKYGIVALVAVLAMSTVAIAFSQSAVAAPANKTTYGASNIGAIAATDGWTPIAYSTIKTSAPSDLRISHNQECTIHTGLNLDQDSEQATSAIREDVRVRIIEADGITSRVVPAVPGTDDDGIVTFCGRAYSIDTNVLSTVYDLCAFVETIEDEFGNTTDVCESDEIYFDSFIRTKQAHSWDWIAMDLGSGYHTIVVESKLINEFDGVGGNVKGKKGSVSEIGDVDTLLEIGKRNLIVVEDKLATGA